MIRRGVDIPQTTHSVLRSIRLVSLHRAAVARVFTALDFLDRRPASLSGDMRMAELRRVFQGNTEYGKSLRLRFL